MRSYCNSPGAPLTIDHNPRFKLEEMSSWLKRQMLMMKILTQDSCHMDNAGPFIMSFFFVSCSRKLDTRYYQLGEKSFLFMPDLKGQTFNLCD